MHWVGSISTPSHRFCAALSGDFRHVSGKRPQIDRRTNLHIHLGFMTLEVGIWYSRQRCLHVQVLLATWSTTKDSSPPRTNKQHISLYLSQISQHLDSLLLRSCVRRGPRTQSSILPRPVHPTTRPMSSTAFKQYFILRPVSLRLHLEPHRLTGF